MRLKGVFIGGAMAFVVIFIFGIAVGGLINSSWNEYVSKDIPSMCYTNLEPSRYFGDGEKSYLYGFNDFPIKSDDNNNLIVLNQEGKKIYGNHVLGTGSMRPAIGKYSIYLYITDFERGDIHVGDIIVIKREEDANLIHRVVEITKEGYITKGDNNNVRDSEVWKFEQIEKKVVGVLY